VIKGIVN